MILTAGRVIEKIKRENKNKVVKYVCPIFQFATQTFNESHKKWIQIKDEQVFCHSWLQRKSFPKDWSIRRTSSMASSKEYTNEEGLNGVVAFTVIG